MARVLFFTTSYPTHPDDPSGHFVRAEALAAARSGLDTHVIAPCPFAQDPGITAHAAGGTSLFSWPGAWTRLAAQPLRGLAALPFGGRALSLLHQLKPYALVAHWMTPTAFPLALCSRTQYPYLEVVCHGADVRLLLTLPSPLRTAIVSRVTHDANIIRFASYSLYYALLNHLPPSLQRSLSDIATVRPPLVNTSHITVPPAQKAPYVVCAGRLIASKRIDLAITALALCPPPLELIVIGDGPERPTLQKRAMGCLQGRIRFLGSLPRSSTLGWIRHARALVHPSATEVAPTVVLEARAIGTPVIATNAGDIARWAQTDHGITVVLRTPEALARALCAVSYSNFKLYRQQRAQLPRTTGRIGELCHTDLHLITEHL